MSFRIAYLNHTVPGVVEPSGTASLTVMPTANEDWVIHLLSVWTRPAAAYVYQPKVSLYRGIVAEGGFLDQTYAGNLDVTDMRILVQSGEFLTAYWESATPGSNVYVRVEGVKVPQSMGVAEFSQSGAGVYGGVI